MKHQIFAIFFLILSACSATTEKYFSADSIPPTLIEPPFAAGSKEQNDEVQQILKLQKNFNLNELELASREKHLRPEIFILYTNRAFTREAYPHLYQLLDRVSVTTKAVNDNAKEYWNVARPYSDKRINILITPSSGPTYPSGHASSSLVNAQILGLLVPQKYSDLQKLAKKIGRRRVLVGMHYAHDIVAGEQMSRLVLGSLMQNKEFKKDFEAARRELEKNPPQSIVTPAPAASVAPNNNALPAQQ